MSGFYSGVITSYISGDGTGHPLLVNGVDLSPNVGDMFTGSFDIRGQGVNAIPTIYFTASFGGLYFAPYTGSVNVHLANNIIGGGYDVVFHTKFDGWDYIGIGDINLSLDLNNNSGSIRASDEEFHGGPFVSFTGNITSIALVPEIGSSALFLGVGIAGIALLLHKRSLRWA
jgi:hypothetical protein